MVHVLKESHSWVFEAIICFKEYSFIMYDYIFEFLGRRATRVSYIETSYFTRDWTKIYYK